MADEMFGEEIFTLTDDEGNEDFSKPYVLAWFNKYLNPYIKVQKIENITPKNNTTRTKFV